MGAASIAAPMRALSAKPFGLSWLTLARELPGSSSTPICGPPPRAAWFAFAMVPVLPWLGSIGREASVPRQS